jgi:hypothetical protein
MFERMRMNSAMISAALDIINERPQPDQIDKKTSNGDFTLTWHRPEHGQNLIVSLYPGGSSVVIGHTRRVWVSLGEICVNMNVEDQSEPIGSGGHYCISFDEYGPPSSIDGLADAFNAALTVPLSVS